MSIDLILTEHMTNWQQINKYFIILKNKQIYTTAIRPLVDSAFDGAKVSCFAYGQTGSGKTYTMLGNGSNVKGLYLLASIDIFNEIKQHHK